MLMTNEKDLVKRAIKGDIVAFEELIIPHQKKVYNIALNFSKNHDDALELAQESFLKAFKSIKTFSEKCLFSTWIYRITTNTCIDNYRKTNNVSLLYIDQEFEDKSDKPYVVELKSDMPEPATAFLHKEVRDFLRDALNRIPVELKSVIVLRDINGFNYDEISKILDLPLGTVKSRISRARQSLKQIIIENTELFDKKYV